VLKSRNVLVLQLLLGKEYLKNVALAHEDDDKQSDLQQALPPVTVAGAAPRVALPADGWFYGTPHDCGLCGRRTRIHLRSFH